MTGSPALGLTVPGGAQSDWTTWAGFVAPPRATKIFYNMGSDPTQPGSTTPTNSTIIATAVNLGMQGLLMFKPAYASNTNGSGLPSNAQMNTDLTNIQTAVNNALTAGLNLMGVGIWNEPNGQGGVQSTTRPMAAQYQKLFSYMYSTLHGNGWPVWAVHTENGYGSPNNLPAAYFPGPGPTSFNPSSLFCDVISVDWYGGAYTSSQYLYANGTGGGINTTFPAWCDLADSNDIPFSIPEAGNAASSTDHTQANITKYLSAVTQDGFVGDPVNSLQAVFEYRAQNGLPTVSFNWWQDNTATTNYTGTTGTNANPCVFTNAGSNLNNNNQVTLSSISGLSGFNNSTTYYVASAGTNTFQLSAYPGGPGLASSSSGSCTATVYGPNLIFSSADYRIPLLQQLVAAGPASSPGPPAPVALRSAISRGSTW